jgi:N-acetylmuramoyl-L-alanine amidase
MGHYPNAIWMPWIPKQGASKGLEPFRIRQPLGLLLHISGYKPNELGDSLQALLNTFNASSETSHFGVTKSGSVGQFIDTANHDWTTEWTVSYFTIECCGCLGDSLTDAQLNSVAALYAWLHETHSIDIKLAISTRDTGLSYHSMGKTGHTSCPGISVINQRQTIIDRANKILSDRQNMSSAVPTSSVSPN